MEKTNALTLAEKKQRWIDALHRKLEMRTLEVTHVHEWTVNPDGSLRRSRKVRLLTAAEIKKYGKKLEAANKHVKYK